MALRGASSLFNMALLATVMVSTCVASEIKAMEQRERKPDTAAVIIVSPQDGCVAHKIEQGLKEGLGVSAYMRCLLGVSKIAASGAAGVLTGLCFREWLEGGRGRNQCECLFICAASSLLAISGFTSGMNDLYKGITGGAQTQCSQQGLSLNQSDESDATVIRLPAGSMNKTLAEIIGDAS